MAHRDPRQGLPLSGEKPGLFFGQPPLRDVDENKGDTVDRSRLYAVARLMVAICTGVAAIVAVVAVLVGIDLYTVVHVDNRQVTAVKSRVIYQNDMRQMQCANARHTGAIHDPIVARICAKPLEPVSK